ncbi:outer membrane beta-barrel protein [Maribacter polysiphoniae]|uniref:Outer membrane beta-barrel protein n=1 Tax=Maribacter polysiphoniae TaxID=429344 RepID=A0A316DXV9_9FLAO|nr:outer membrane beta-barrel protein [Maribacter polysiphoniae]MBD1261631.1 outer membrane beta-barrel protein [Maribacter polysiphoniae]PWK22566.1 outer membrane protein with beta-barrel domain [Maribacter polysiphoniae]
MKYKLLLFPVLFFSINSIAQDLNYKWSAEANYPISIGDELGNDTPGIIDLGLKYRFVNLDFVTFGAGINAGIFHDNIQSYDGNGSDFDETNTFIQPKVFAEFNIPGMDKLRPSIGLGYTIVRSKFDGTLGNFTETPEEAILSVTESDGGINLNLGLSYDIGKRFYIQAQYDYIRLNVRRDNSQLNKDQNLGLLKFGFGFRF